MYDDENEIRRKRRNLIIIIVVIIVAIILLLILLGTLGGSKKSKVPPTQLSCTLEAEREPDSSGVYTSPVVVTVNATPSTNASITEKNVGIKENNKRNKESYTVSSDGKTVLIGYVEDSTGASATCETTISVSIAKPTCTLVVSKGTEGNDNWYTSDVEVSFGEKNSNSSATISSYTITKEKGASDIVSRANGNTDSIVVKEDGIIDLTGTIIDSDGKEGTCSLTIKRDAEKPTCALKVTSGNPNSSGVYLADVTVEFDTSEDKISSIKEKGIGIKEEFKEQSYTVKENGKFNVNGYVKDVAGNVGTCTLEINRKTPPKSVPSCELEIVGTLKDSNYIGETTIKFKSKNSTNGASITAFGIGNSNDYEAYNTNGTEFLNGKENIVLSGTKEEKIVPYGMVKDSNDEIATCTLSEVKVIPKPASLSKPTCELEVKTGTLNGDSYLNNAVVGFKSATSTDGATITKKGIAEGNNPTLNGQETISLGRGTHDIYGIVRDSNGNVSKCGPFTVKVSTGNSLLAKTVKVGDTVNYDPGKWDESAPFPNAEFKLGGYTKGTSKSTGISCGTAITASGWVVVYNDGKVVKIATQGNPACFMIPTNSNSNSIGVSYLNLVAKTNYINTTYATDAANMDYVIASQLVGKKYADQRSVLLTGERYYLSTLGDNGRTLKSVLAGLEKFSDASGRAFGIRPVVTLKENVYTTGQDKNGNYVLTTASTRGLIGTDEQSFEDKAIEILESLLV